MTRNIIAASVVALLLIALAAAFRPSGAPSDDAPIENNVSVVDGVQIVDVRAKGGYLPRRSIAKAGIPTVVRFATNGTYDCSAAVSIPSLKIQTLLKPTGESEIDIGTPEAGTLYGSCSMGMYPFEIEFVQ